MRPPYWLNLTAAALALAGCSGPERPAPQAKQAAAPAPNPDPPRITQLYVTEKSVPPGGKSLLCYGVENAKAVWLSPPRRELSAAMSRCVDVTPSATTTYTLTAEGPGGKPATQQVTVAIGAAPAPKVRIVDVTVSALTVPRGNPVSICYHVERAEQVTVEPTGFRGGPKTEGCTVVQPQQTTTYTVVAKGEDGEDTQKVTVKVQ